MNKNGREHEKEFDLDRPIELRAGHHVLWEDNMNKDEWKIQGSSLNCNDRSVIDKLSCSHPGNKVRICSFENCPIRVIIKDGN